MFNCKKLFKLQTGPPGLILLITTSQDRWIFPSQNWEVRNSKMMMMMMMMLLLLLLMMIIIIIIHSPLSYFQWHKTRGFRLMSAWTDLAQDRDGWRSVVNAIMALPITWNAGCFLTNWGPVIFSRRTLFFGVSEWVSEWVSKLVS